MPSPLAEDSKVSISPSKNLPEPMALDFPEAAVPPPFSTVEQRTVKAEEKKSPVTKQKPVGTTPVMKTLDKMAISDNESADESDRDSSSGEDDVPLIKRTGTTTNTTASRQSSKPKSRIVESESEDESDDEDDVPLKKAVLAKKRRLVEEEDDEISDDESDSESDVSEPAPKMKKKPSKKPPVKKKPGKKQRDDGEDFDSDSSDDEPLVKKVKKAKTPAKKKTKKSSEGAKTTPKKSAPKKSTKSPEKSEPEDENVFKWWESTSWDDSVKWTTLEHNGVYFPPEYISHGVKMKYDGVEVTLSPQSEEVAGFFAQLIGTQYAENPTFCKNFFDDFLEVLREKDPNCPIKRFDKCDFSPMTEHFEKLRELKKSMSKEEKEKLKEEKKKIDEQFSYAYVDGRKEKVGNFRIEPPGLFRGRGDHPKTGKLKRRVRPEDITINIGAEAKIPVLPAGHTWGKIVHDNTVLWLANWNENVNGNNKYVMFAASSSFKGMSDYKKFEKARELKTHIHAIRKQYTEELKDKVMGIRQRATALWLIDRLALRAGHEKGEDEADTVGCCSLRFEHVQLEEETALVEDIDNPGQLREIKKKIVVFDFLGKDSIRYYNKVEVDPVVWKNIKIFKRPPKADGDPLFDRLTTSSVNKHLNNLMSGLTAKVFRTHNASSTFQEELKKTPKDGTVAEKILAFNRANRQVAILCNHQRSVSKAFSAQMEKLDEKILAMKYERHCVRKALVKADPKVKKRRPEIVEPESDMDNDTINRKHKDYIEQEELKLEKKYEKMCEKAIAEGEEKPEKPVFEEKPLSEDPEKLEKKFDQLTIRINLAKTQKIDKDENKTTALGTSKTNYLDPRITASWCKKYDVPVEKMFTKTLREKFVWAMDVDENWIF